MTKGSCANKIEMSFFGLNDRARRWRAHDRSSISRCGPRRANASTRTAFASTRAINLPPGRYQLRIGAREELGGLTGTVFYDLEVPDFRKEKLMLGGLLLAAASTQQTPSIQPDPVVAKLLPAAATSRREFPRGDIARALHGDLRQHHGSPGTALRRDHPPAVGGRQRGVHEPRRAGERAEAR